MAKATFKCLFCIRKFLTLEKLENHINLHTREKPYICKEKGDNGAQCLMEFTTENQKLRHADQHKRQREEFVTPSPSLPPAQNVKQACRKRKGEIPAGRKIAKAKKKLFTMSEVDSNNNEVATSVTEMDINNNEGSGFQEMDSNNNEVTTSTFKEKATKQLKHWRAARKY